MSLSSRKRNTLLELEAWDYLRDSLLLIATRHYFCDEEPVALAVAPSVCLAMTCLFCAAGPQSSASSLDSCRLQNPECVITKGSYMLTSPWTMNLCALLKAAIEDISEKDSFALVLKERLEVCGAELLDQVGI